MLSYNIQINLLPLHRTIWQQLQLFLISYTGIVFTEKRKEINKSVSIFWDCLQNTDYVTCLLNHKTLEDC